MLGYLEMSYYGITPSNVRDQRLIANIKRMRSAGCLVPLNRGKGEGTKRAIAREEAVERARQEQRARLQMQEAA